ncbi:hypothetical protein R9K26_03865, partial [Escherichia coli]
ADRNRSHWSTSKTPSYTKSVSWQHHHTYVNFDIEDYAIVGGNPARIIGYRFEEEIIEKLKTIKWWKHDISSVIYQNKPNTIDYINNIKLIEQLYNIKDTLPKLIKKDITIINIKTFWWKINVIK